MNYHWNWRIYWEMSPDGVGTYMDTLWSGLTWTLATAGVAWIMALGLGLVIGTLRTLPNKWLVALANAYIELFRNIPLLVQMFLWYFVMPELLPQAAGDWVKSLPNAPFVTAVLCLGTFTSSRVAIQVATGIQSLPRGQKLAGTALGLTLPQTYRYILLPMATRVILPPLSSEFLNIIKNSSVALTIGLIELTASARAIQEFSFQVFEAFSAATIIYIAVNLLVVLLMSLIEKKVAIPGFAVAGSTAGGH
ncbi:amino acid ABC transporter permease [Janthinobacterium agaricidamnosum]|uniref:Amino ABC transporter, permease, 3-TM region, His/Glu/Gln/Arg/opine family domain protein n=1 Tax=Janthinobacterium agaricidamnosum NBRC 102515 = DSM 9628 TaxID=1349767 RepID=W0UZB9_9BURK|nr:amino acid ABC transporter permease [Janthinobacterium agaricidamnosum]CDG80941.1 amino ABC transporter, permease, 3-TM region, His/Glu/Gln/Arg/opine family domain protein [Janthinobacterium agaricidamnosum NBRC 102515 = DSM 9628]